MSGGLALCRQQCVIQALKHWLRSVDDFHLLQWQLQHISKPSSARDMFEFLNIHMNMRTCMKIMLQVGAFISTIGDFTVCYSLPNFSLMGPEKGSGFRGSSGHLIQLQPLSGFGCFENVTGCLESLCVHCVYIVCTLCVCGVLQAGHAVTSRNSERKKHY